jgi:hypothetical protein
MTTLDNVYLFFRDGHFYPVNCRNDDDARNQAELNPGTIKVENVDGKVIWPDTRH